MLMILTFISIQFQAGISPLLQQQLVQLAQHKPKGNMNLDSSKGNKFVVIGQGCIEPLEALRSSGQEVVPFSLLED